MLPLEYFSQTNPLFCIRCDGDYLTVTKLRNIWPFSVFLVIVGFRTVVSIIYDYYYLLSVLQECDYLVFSGNVIMKSSAGM